MNNAEQLEKITVEDFKLIAENLYPDVIYDVRVSDGACEVNTITGRISFNPLTNDAQAWQLMQWYREALKEKEQLFMNRAGFLFHATQSNRALVLAVLEFIKDGE